MQAPATLLHLQPPLITSHEGALDVDEGPDEVASTRSIFNALAQLVLLSLRPVLDLAVRSRLELFLRPPRAWTTWVSQANGFIDSMIFRDIPRREINRRTW